MEEDFLTITIKLFIIFFCTFFLPSSAILLDENDLQRGFYQQTCPRAENIVTRTVSGAVVANSTLAAGLIRLHFHDCFVKGCDASILLDITPSGEPVEGDAPGNTRTLRGTEVIDRAKAQLEQECPGIVSCSDVLAFAARDAAVLSGIRYYTVPGGRRDGNVSSAADVTKEIPRPSYSVDKLTDIFVQKGLTQEEMVVLSGAHSIGVAHCINFANRLQNLDPTMDIFYANLLKQTCPKPETATTEELVTTAVPLDSITPFKLDRKYYVGLMRGRGLLSSDHALAQDPSTSEIVRMMALRPFMWSNKFGPAMIRMGSIGVLTGDQGEIRKNCHFTN